MGKRLQYGVVLDAGSSGTRVYVYSWPGVDTADSKSSELRASSLPSITTHKKWNKKVHPGISTYGDRPEMVKEHLEDLVDFARDIVPKDAAASTPIFLLATAGMRLLPARQRLAVLESACTYFKTHTNFLVPECDLHVQVIPGETEGLYGWIAANYLLGGFDAPEKHDHGKGGHHTYGFLDMGGASAQIAFEPNATESTKHAQDLKLLRLRKVNGEPLEYRVFVTTWLGFGANEARRRYVESLIETYHSEKELPDPCLPTGLLVTKTGNEFKPDANNFQSQEPHLRGTGKFAECLKRTYPLLEKDKPCDDAPCLLNGIHTPAIDFAVNHFVGVSEYWHTTHEIFAMAHKDKAYDFETYQKQVTEFCSRDWLDIEKDVSQHKWGKKVDEKTVEEVCFKASWLISMLHDGIGIPRYGIDPIHHPGDLWSNKTNEMIDSAKDTGFLDSFQAVDKINGKEVSWTLGKMVLYASSQVPPTNSDALAVGFGSNVAGNKLPSDFSFPGGKYEPVAPLPDLIDQQRPQNNTDETNDWHDRILSTDFSRRAPGFLIFVLILILAIYLLCGRDRRTHVLNKVLTVFGRKPGSPRIRRRPKTSGILSGKLFGSASDPAYERVLESGDPDDWELGSIVGSNSGRPGSSDSDGVVSVTGPGLGLTTNEVPRVGRTSGWATPALSTTPRGMSPDFTRTPPRGWGGLYPEGQAPSSTVSLVVPAAATGLGGLTAFDRGGLMSRTESRERLAPRETRSRMTSPARRSPLMLPMNKSSVD